MFKTFRNKQAYKRASSAKASDEIVCATLVNEKPVYFHMPKDSTEAEVRAKAFEIRTGREMSKIERTLVDIVEVQS
jgi:TPP-dependent 2-oxoacid decarboxylase